MFGMRGRLVGRACARGRRLLAWDTGDVRGPNLRGMRQRADVSACRRVRARAALPCALRRLCPSARRPVASSGHGAVPLAVPAVSVAGASPASPRLEAWTTTRRGRRPGRPRRRPRPARVGGHRPGALRGRLRRRPEAWRLHGARNALDAGGRARQPLRRDRLRALARARFWAAGGHRTCASAAAGGWAPRRRRAELRQLAASSLRGCLVSPRPSSAPFALHRSRARAPARDPLRGGRASDVDHT